MFDGDVGRLTGAQLKAHIQSICGIPQDQQILTFNGLNVTNGSTGHELGFHSGAMLLLDTVARGGLATTAGFPASTSRTTAVDGVRGSSSSDAGQPNSSFVRAPPPAPLSVQRAASSRGGASRFEEQLEAVRREESLAAPPAAVHHHTVSQRGLSRSAAPGAAASVVPVPYPAPGVYDDLDLDVEVVEEAGGALWQPTNSVDVEEARLIQQDYIWKMEQVRFETERMNREREMMRQRQELDYQSELLERERIELERKTHSERLKLSILQSTLHDEMNINARVSALSEESVHRQRY
jgi:hypothetical protein